MMKLFSRWLLAAVAVMMAAQVSAYQINGDTDVGGLDIFKGQMQKTGSSSPEVEQAWAESVLGFELDFSNVKTETVSYYMTEATNVIAFELMSDPGYYLIKNARWFALFENTASLGWGVIDISPLSSGFNLQYGCSDCVFTISHVTEFNSWQATVSEPGSALLMLLGALGLWVGRRQQRA